MPILNDLLFSQSTQSQMAGEHTSVGAAPRLTSYPSNEPPLSRLTRRRTMTHTTSQLSRRQMLKTMLAAGAAPAFLRNLRAAPPSEKIRHASFGAAGMARADIDQLTSHPLCELVCVAEVDDSRAAQLLQKYPQVKVYTDWRELLDREAAQLHAVNVSTPDHMHAPIAMACMQRGLAVYCQKPLTHTVYEARRLAEVARDKGCVTQMGIQIHSHTAYRTAVAWIQQGVIGPVHTVHSWSNKKWGDPTPRPDRSDPVPAGFHWNLWLGVAAERPYIGEGYYHPGNWRKRLDFGTGTFGDMGCHILDPVCQALALTAPRRVKSTGSVPNAWNWANDVRVEYSFPSSPFTAPEGLTLHWYDGDQRPAREQTAPWLEEQPLPDQGSLFIGSRGALLLPHIAMPILLPRGEFAQRPRTPVEGRHHWHDFLNAVRGEGRTTAGFDYAGPLTEWVLLGGIASFFPEQELIWDASSLQFPKHPAANARLRRTYRPGWEVPGLT
ncbi:MAG: NADH-dependent dehydrogenase [Planctomycetaceae bacterium]|nr:MAG: NADH-dependent dehydrogenase [Planctomycetaceae bacterium]